MDDPIRMSLDRAAETLLSDARDLPQGDDAVWEGRRTIWKEPNTWVPAVDRLKARAEAIIDAHPVLHYMKDGLDGALAELGNEIDHGKAYVVVSDEALLDDSAHYLIHGSEWIMSLFHEDGRSILRSIGAPTLIEIDLPLAITHSSTAVPLPRICCRNGHVWPATGRNGLRRSITPFFCARCSAEVCCRAFPPRRDNEPPRSDAALPFAHHDA